MLSEEVIRKIRKIEIRSRRTVTDVFAGEYKSVFKGKGMEFLEVREYFPGDDIRTIDWNVTARTGIPYVKKFAEERELTLMILLDASASFDFGTKTRIKRELAAEIGGVLAFCSLRNNDKLSLAVFTDKIEKFIPPAKGTAHVLTTIKEILYFKPENKKTDMKLALEYVSRVMAKRFILFIISDFLTPGYEQALKIVSKKQDVIPIRMLDPLEIELPSAGVVEFEDPESMQNIVVDTSDSQFRKNFVLKRKERHEEVKSFFKNSGIDCIDIRTNEDYMKPLIKFFAMRARRMR